MIAEGTVEQRQWTHGHVKLIVCVVSRLGVEEPFA